MNNCFDFFVCIFWRCRPEVLGLFTLPISLLLDFISSLLLSLFLEVTSSFSEKKREIFFEILYFLGISGTGLILFKGLEAVISSREVSGERTVLRVLDKPSAKLGNTFWEMVTDVVGTKTGAIFGRAISIEVTVFSVQEVENEYSGTPLRLKR